MRIRINVSIVLTYDVLLLFLPIYRYYGMLYAVILFTYPSWYAFDPTARRCGLLLDTIKKQIQRTKELQAVRLHPSEEESQSLDERDCVNGEANASSTSIDETKASLSWQSQTLSSEETRVADENDDLP